MKCLKVFVKLRKKRSFYESGGFLVWFSRAVGVVGDDVVGTGWMI